MSLQDPKNLNKLLKQVLITSQRYVAGLISISEASLTISTLVDEHREEIAYYKDKEWPAALKAIVYRVTVAGIRNSVIEDLKKTTAQRVKEALERLGKKYDVSALKEAFEKSGVLK